MIGQWTNRQRQIVIGTVLGGSSLVKPAKGTNYYLAMRSTNADWLHYKMSELSELYKSDNLIKDDNTYRCNSTSSPLFTELQQELYVEGQRKVSIDLLDTMMDIGLAIWFLDSGSKMGRGRKNAYINTTKLGEASTQTVLEYYRSLEIDCGICKSQNRLRILFGVDGTDRLFKIISPCVPEFMLYL